MKDSNLIIKVENERAELSEKISKLRMFLDGKNRKLLSTTQDILLNLQLDTMQTYFDILTYRITDLRNEQQKEPISKNITSDYLNALSACSGDLNLIKRKDYSHLLTLYNLAEKENKRFVDDVDKFDEIITKLTTGECSIVRNRIER